MASTSLSAEVGSNDETHVVDITAAETTKESEKTHQRQILRRVPAKLRENRKDIYDPVVLSLGPYHCNLQSEEFLHVEGFKNDILNNMLDPSAQESFHKKILERVDEIRTFYGGLSIEKYKDEALAKMMFRDACFLLSYMELPSGDSERLMHFYLRLRLPVTSFLPQDLFMLENQIPFWVIKLLITLKFHDTNKEEALLCKFLSLMCFGDIQRLRRLPWKGEDHQEPLHLLEALCKTHTVQMDSNYDIEHHGKICRLIKWMRKGSIYRTQDSTGFEMVSSIFRSVTDLKAKGIHFGPSSYCLKDIKFNSYALYGKLLLPIWLVSKNSEVFFSNAIAFDFSQEPFSNYEILSYVNFMKSLLETPEDVKELREKRILFSSLRNDEAVLKVFKEINIYGIDEAFIFHDIKMRINKHCDSKIQMWVAELIQTYFRSPWTAIALFGGIFLLCLTFLQTYYTMNPMKIN